MTRPYSEVSIREYRNRSLPRRSEHTHIFAITSPPGGVHIFACPGSFRNFAPKPCIFSHTIPVCSPCPPLSFIVFIGKYYTALFAYRERFLLACGASHTISALAPRSRRSSRKAEEEFFPIPLAIVVPATLRETASLCFVVVALIKEFRFDVFVWNPVADVDQCP